MEEVIEQSSVLHWSSEFALGHAEMDQTHQEFVELLGRIQSAANEDMERLLEELLHHCTKHFEMENQWMTSTGFPPRECHIEEHAKVLGSIQEVLDQARQGINYFCRPLANHLADWFPPHAAHLDSALAHWMCKQRFGGKPVVFR